MSMLFNETYIHILDTSIDLPVLSTSPLVLSDETEALITSYFVNLFDNHSVSKGHFTENSPYQATLIQDPFDLLPFSLEVTQALFAFMQTTPSVPSGDLIFSTFNRDGVPFVGILKINYKEAFTHFVSQGDSGQITSLIKHKSIFPDVTSKLQEAVVINLETLECLVLNTLRVKYLHDFFGIGLTLSVKEQIKVVEQVVSHAIEENFENKIEGISFAKNNIAKSIDSSQSLELETILEDTFGEHETIISSCLEACQKQGVLEKKIDVPQPQKLHKQYTSHKLKTNTGIELKLPTDMLTDPETIEFINNPDGTLSILIKNIAQLINK